MGSVMNDSVDQPQIGVYEIIPGSWLMSQAALNQLLIVLRERHGLPSSRQPYTPVAGDFELVCAIRRYILRSLPSWWARKRCAVIRLSQSQVGLRREGSM